MDDVGIYALGIVQVLELGFGGKGICGKPIEEFQVTSAEKSSEISQLGNGDRDAHTPRFGNWQACWDEMSRGGEGSGLRTMWVSTRPGMMNSPGFRCTRV